MFSMFRVLWNILEDYSSRCTLDVGFFININLYSHKRNSESLAVNSHLLKWERSSDKDGQSNTNSEYLEEKP